MILEIIINTYNKEKTILNTYTKISEELKDVKHRFIFVDDCSDDKTLEILKNIQKKNENSVKIISFSKKYGKEMAIYAGLLHSKHDLVCIYDTDLQANTSHIGKMLEFLKTHDDYDQVCMYSNGMEKSYLKRTKRRLFNTIFDLHIDNNKAYYRMMRRNVVMGILKQANVYSFNKYIFDSIGFNTYYSKFENKYIEEINPKELIEYSPRPYYHIRCTSLMIFIASIIIFILSIFKQIKVSNNVIFLFILLFNSLNLFVLSRFSKSKCKTKNQFIIKEKIGFDENVL